MGRHAGGAHGAAREVFVVVQASVLRTMLRGVSSPMGRQELMRGVGLSLSCRALACSSHSHTRCHTRRQHRALHLAVRAAPTTWQVPQQEPHWMGLSTLPVTDSRLPPQTGHM